METLEQRKHLGNMDVIVLSSYWISLQVGFFPVEIAEGDPIKVCLKLPVPNSQGSKNCKIFAEGVLWQYTLFHR